MLQESIDGDAPMRDRRARARMIIYWAWLASLVAAFLATCWYLRSFVTDDAWITVRYAENLANGQGFGWNLSGEPTEGFSHPLLDFLAWGDRAFASDGEGAKLGLSTDERLLRKRNPA